MTTNSHDKWLGFMDANQDTMTVRDEEWCFESWNAAWSAAIEFAVKVCDDINQKMYEIYLNDDVMSPIAKSSILGESFGAEHCAEQIRKKGSE